LCAAFLSLCFTAQAHDIPSDVTVQAFVKPEREHLNLVMRVPLNALRDTQFPERGRGYLDLDRTDPVLRDAARLWLSDFIELYEENERLPNPRVV
jgi:hypothetical protein